jgi:hypothetical protein
MIEIEPGCGSSGLRRGRMKWFGPRVMGKCEPVVREGFHEIVSEGFHGVVRKGLQRLLAGVDHSYILQSFSCALLKVRIVFSLVTKTFLPEAPPAEHGKMPFLLFLLFLLNSQDI